MVPHIFLLQAMHQLAYRITVEEYDLFVNLARSHNDLERIVRYILSWRDLVVDERNVVLAALRRSPKSSRRYRRISQNSSYQRA